MISIIRTQNKIKRKYCLHDENFYISSFLQDISSVFYWHLEEKRNRQSFFSFEPEGCMAEKLIKGQRYFNSLGFDTTIGRVAYSLLAYGQAYMYIQPNYSTKKEDDGLEAKELAEFEINEIQGIIRWRTKDKYFFARRGYGNNDNNMVIKKSLLIILDLKDLGYSRNHFSRIFRKLSKCDITTYSNEMMEEPDYYFYANNKNKFAELKLLKKLGWAPGYEKLSDSYFLLKKIQQDKLRIQILDYIIKKINSGLADFLGENAGRLVAHINRMDYDQLWNSYQEGKITGTELSEIVFRNKCI